MPERDFFGYLQALGPLIAASLAALVAIGVGLMHRSTQKQIAKQNLFEKRWKVYIAVRKYLEWSVSLDDDTVPSDDRSIRAYSEYWGETAPGEFLFDTPVWEYICEVGRRGVEFRRVRDRFMLLKRRYAFLPIDTEEWPLEIEEARRKDSEMMSLALSFTDGLALFDKYLRLDELDPWYARLEAYMGRLNNHGEEFFKSRYRDPASK